jgi:eukaryotic-like serine/threonine-protein kinase
MATSERESQMTAWLATMDATVADTIQHDPRATIAPPSPARITAGKRALRVLHGLAEGTTAGLEVERTLGQGGMGLVRLATQVALGRAVAVKSLRPDRRTDETTMDLLREAWITGSLEHPNVVPVHDLGIDQDGSPMIVLKRIEGVAWSGLVHDAGTVRERFGADDLLAWNLGILLQVINAVRFAHSRGIIHRDLKPDNVMIGEFGEVYVLDWGLALSVRDDLTGHLPLASEARDMAGTPCYMAPEMLGQGHAPLSERTDIYLLGAILYELIAGYPPHQGETALDIMTSVVLSSPRLPEDAPADLARICRRAMEPDPQGRFERAEELHLAIQGFLQHRGSARLARGAERHLDELIELLAADRATSDDTAWRQQIYRRLGACRFGFQEALAAWPGNQAATQGLCRAVLAMVEYELASGDPRAAATLLAELADEHVPAALKGRVDQALGALQSDKQRIAELERLGADLDLAAGSRTRGFIASIMACVWIVLPLAGQYVGLSIERLSYRPMLLGTAGFFVVVLALMVWARESMTRTAVNRRTMASVVFVLVAQLILHGAGWRLGIEPVALLTLNIFLWFSAAGFLAITVDIHLAPVALGYLAALVMAVLRPDLILFAIAGGNLVLFVNTLAMLWRFRHHYAGA